MFGKHHFCFFANGLLTCTFLQVLQWATDTLQPLAQLFLEVGFSHDGTELLAKHLGLGQLSPPPL